MYRDTYVIVPVYNEMPVIGDVIKDLQAIFSNIICVDDGSTDDSVAEISKTRATLLQHGRNRGQGAALRTGISYALKDKSAKYFVTFDADGQHRVIDAKKLVDGLRARKLDVNLGSRFLGTAEDISLVKKILLKMAIVFSNKTTGLRLTDTHNGLRAFNRHFAENLRLKCNGMAHASEIIYRIREGNFRYGETAVTIRYTDYSKANGQSVFNSFNILWELWAMRRQTDPSS